jgi:hypothetical protein
MAPHAEPILICSRYQYELLRARVEGLPVPPDPGLVELVELAEAMEAAIARALERKKTAGPDDGSAAGGGG